MNIKNSVGIKITACALAVILTAGTVQASAYAVKNTVKENVNVTVVNDDVINKTADDNSKTDGSISKEETVYILSNPDGSTRKVIVSDWLKNTINSGSLADYSELKDITNVKGDEEFSKTADALTWDADGKDIYYQGTIEKELPVDMSIHYILDGKDISAEDVAGKSGKLTIRFEFTNNQKETVKINDKDTIIYVPFVMITGMILDSDIFSNVEVTNGRVISDGDKEAVVGYALPGMQESLNIDKEKFEFPDYFEITADVKNFELTTTLTIATNKVFNSVDIDENADMGEITDAIHQLSEATNQLIDGSDALHGGLETLYDKSGELVDGVNKLTDGSKSLNDGAAALNDGTMTLSSGAKSLNEGAVTLNFGVKSLYEGAVKLNNGATSLSDGAATLNSGATTLNNGAASLNDGAYALKNGAGSLNDGLNVLSAGINSLDDGIKSLGSGADTLSEGADRINEGAGRLYSGSSELADGADQLKDGLSKLAESSDTLNNGAKTVFESLLAMADSQLESAGLSVPRLTIENYASVLDGVKATLDEGTVRQMAYNTALEKVSAAVLAQENVIKTQVEAAVRLQVLEGVLNAIGQPMTADQYSQAVSAGAVNAEQQAQIEAAVKAQMNSTQIREVISNTTAAKEQELINQNMQSADVQSQIEDAVSSALNGQGSITALKAQLDSYNQFYIGLKTYTAGVDSAYSGSSDLAAGAHSVADGSRELASGTKELAVGVGTFTNGATQLTDGSSQLISGADRLVSGSGELLNGAAQLTDGSKSLADGTKQLAGGLSSLADGAKELANGSGSLTDGARQLVDGSDSLTDGTKQLSDGSGKLVEGTKQLVEGSGTLYGGLKTLQDGSGALIDGVSKLKDGSKELSDGIKKFNEEGIQKIIDAFDGDLSELVARFKAIMDASRNYNSFAGISDKMDGSVKFIYRTDSIEADIKKK